jgi:eukaryotic-like serine/threonine-protein kinase
MPLAAGTRLGPYEIVAPLGAGGMGEVYLARDTRLGRDVAIKVLAGHLSANPEVRSRFEREARTISSLNHPHICTLFDVGRAPGEAGSEGIDYLVMERIEGETLAQRLQRGPLPIADVLRIGAQIADALDRAHRAGVVHRDLKPGNVMLTKSGAKLMDFGLARAAGPGAGGAHSANFTQSPTADAPLTAEGTIVGTFQYMAPEQLEGREADERSDLWALGCVLHEMATGKPAFQGRSRATLISAIMSSEPPAVSASAPLSPPALDRLVRTCLTKDPDERARSAHDLKLQLRGLLEAGSGSGAAAAPAAGAPPSSTRAAWLVAGAAVVLALAMGAMLVSRGRTPRRPVHVTLDADARQELQQYVAGIAIAPNGTMVAYCADDSSGNRAIWLRRFDSPTPTLLLSLAGWTGRTGATQLTWSPDGRSVAAYGNIGRVITVPVTGGAPTEVCPANIARGASWNQKGVILFAPTTQSGLFRVPASGGTPAPVTTLDSTRHESSHRFPCFLPDGEHFLFAALPPGPEGFDIYAGSLGSRDVRKVLTAGSAVTYAAPGYLLYRRNEDVVAQRFDVRRLATIGDPLRITAAPRYNDLDAEPVATASEDGRLVTLWNPAPDAQLAWIDRSGAPIGTLALPPGPWEAPVLSPDDRYAVVANNGDLWRVDLARSVVLRLTAKEPSEYNNLPVWSPDGSSIAFARGGQGREEMYVMNSDGSGTPRKLETTDDLFKNATDWCREGIVLMALRARTLRDVVLKTYPEGEVRPLVETPFVEKDGHVSPDGRWLAYYSLEANTNDLYIQSFPEPGHKVRVTSGGASDSRWMPGSDAICYRTGHRWWKVKLTRTGSEFDVGTPEPLLTLPPDCIDSELTHDGQRALVTIAPGSAAARRMRVVMDWVGMVGR